MRISVPGNDIGRVLGTQLDSQVNSWVNTLSQNINLNMSNEAKHNHQLMRDTMATVNRYTNSRIIEDIQAKTVSYEYNKFGRYNTLRKVRSAEVEDIPYIMSYPTLSRLNSQGELEGYGEDYDNYIIPHLPEHNRNWLAITGGVRLQDGVVRNYNEFGSNLRKFSISEKLNYQEALDVIDDAIDDGLDPTSRYGSVF